MTLPRQEWNKIRDHAYRISKVPPKFSFPVMVGLAQMWSWFLKADIVSVQHKQLNSINLFGPYDIQVIRTKSINILPLWVQDLCPWIIEGRCEMLRVQVYKSKWLFWGCMKCIRKPVFCKDYRAWTPLFSMLVMFGSSQAGIKRNRVDWVDCARLWIQNSDKVIAKHLHCSLQTRQCEWWRKRSREFDKYKKKCRWCFLDIYPRAGRDKDLARDTWTVSQAPSQLMILLGFILPKLHYIRYIGVIIYNNNIYNNQLWEFQ